MRRGAARQLGWWWSGAGSEPAARCFMRLVDGRPQAAAPCALAAPASLSQHSKPGSQAQSGSVHAALSACYRSCSPSSLAVGSPEFGCGACTDVGWPLREPSVALRRWRWLSRVGTARGRLEPCARGACARQQSSRGRMAEARACRASGLVLRSLLACLCCESGPSPEHGLSLNRHMPAALPRDGNGALPHLSKGSERAARLSWLALINTAHTTGASFAASQAAPKLSQVSPACRLGRAAAASSPALPRFSFSHRPASATMCVVSPAGRCGASARHV